MFLFCLVVVVSFCLCFVLNWLLALFCGFGTWVFVNLFVGRLRCLDLFEWFGFVF